MSQESAKMRLLLVDDDRELCELLRDYLTPLGYDVHAAHTGPEGAERVVAEEWQAVILDVMMPGMDGFDVLKSIRRTSQVPVLMLTSRGDETDRIVGLEVGADDYLPKTFSMRELLARLRAVTRRSAAAQGSDKTISPDKKTDDWVPEVVVGAIRVNPNTRLALMHDKPLSLTPVEFEFLLALAKAKGRVKTREQLLDQIRDREWEVFDRSVDVHIAALRRKLGDDAKQPRYIRTLRSAGYMLIDPE